MREGADFFRGVTDCRSSFCLSVFTSEKLHPLLNRNIYKTVSQYDEQDLNKRPKSRGKTTYQELKFQNQNQLRYMIKFIKLIKVSSKSKIVL